MEVEKSNRLGLAASKIGSEPGLPTFKNLINGILGALDEPTTRLPELKAMVARDYSLSLKLFRTANSALYNRSGQPIRDLQHVIMLLGNRAVRELASTIVYLQEYARRPGGLRELLLLSLLTAQVARELAMKVRCDAPETCYLAGMFSNLGEVLVAAHFPAEFLEIRVRATYPEHPEPRVVREVLGYEFADLGRAVGGEWGLPAEAMRTMVTGAVEPLLPQERVVRFAHELTVAAFATAEARRGDAIEQVNQRYLKVLRLTGAEVAPVITSAAIEMSSVFADAEIQIDDLRLLSDARMAGLLAARADREEGELSVAAG